jgi:hypothetical protein
VHDDLERNTCIFEDEPNQETASPFQNTTEGWMRKEVREEAEDEKNMGRVREDQKKEPGRKTERRKG